MDFNRVKEILQKESYKLTKQREAILKVILENPDEHLSCDGIYQIVTKKSPDLGIATVYRTLQLFEKLGIVYKLDFDEGLSRYELTPGKEGHQHHHLVCMECGKVIEVKLDLLESLEESIEREEDFTIVDHNLKFYGYCGECKNKSL